MDSVCEDTTVLKEFIEQDRLYDFLVGLYAKFHEGFMFLENRNCNVLMRW